MAKPVTIAEVQSYLAVTTAEPIVGIMEQRKFGRRALERIAGLPEAEFLAYLPRDKHGREPFVAFARRMLHEFRRQPADGYSDAYNPRAFAYDLINLLTDATSRAASAGRA